MCLIADTPSADILLQHVHTHTHTQSAQHRIPRTLSQPVEKLRDNENSRSNLSRMGEKEKYTGFWWESPKERNHLKDRGVDGRMELEWILGRLVGGVECIHLAQDKDNWRTIVSQVMNLRFLVLRS
jgi:hypothetical protein